MLHALQAKFGYVDPAAVPIMASALNLSRAEVHGVITFYHDFRQHPGGRHTIKICRAEACQSMGADALIEHVKDHLGVDFHGTTSDGAFTLEAAYCLGNCACSPAMLVGDELYGRLDEKRFDSIIQEWAGVA
jgi:formate dehydrogenase subunit gamma